MKNVPKRICIYPKDIEIVTGKSYRQSTRMLTAMKVKLNKNEDQMVSIEEFCQFIGLKREEVEPLILG